MSFVNFAKTHGKVKVRPYSMGGNKWTALLCKDDEGNETFISPPKDTNQVINQNGEILVDFDLPAEIIAEQIKAHKNDLVVIVSNKNWEESDEPENLIYTLAAKIEVEEIMIDVGVNDEFGVEYSHDGKRLIRGNDQIENYTIKEGTETICDSAFEFEGGSKLKEIYFPVGVKTIEAHAFEGCKKLEIVDISDTVELIGDRAFGCCHSLKRITIPESVNILGDGVFDGCTSLRTIIFEGVVRKLGNINEWFGSGSYAPVSGEYLYGIEYASELHEYGYDINESYYESEFDFQRKNWNKLKILIPLGAESNYSELLDVYNSQKKNYELRSDDYIICSSSKIKDSNLFVGLNKYHFEPFIQFSESFEKWEVRPGKDRNVLVCINNDGAELYIEPPSQEEILILTLVDFTKAAKDVVNAIKKNRNSLMIRYRLDEDDCLVGFPTLVDKTYYDNYLVKSYEREINELSSHTFSAIRDISVKFMQKLDDEYKDELYERLNHGVGILTSNEQLHAYMYCFGLMHEAKLNRAFREIPSGLFKPEIEIIDYACGQGIATICFANFLEDNDFFIETNDIATEIEKITLIDPSLISLSRASLICHKVYPDALIESINSDFDELKSSQVAPTNILRIHLLSNILDMTCYDLNHLAKVIGKISNKGDIFICVDPWYHDSNLDGRQRKLMRLLKGKEIYHETFNSYQLVSDRAWTAYITIFKI